MAFEWGRFLDLAEELSVRADEAALRTAVSRAYYGLLGSAVAALPPADRPALGHGQVHIATWNRYAASSARPCRQIGHTGHRLRLERIAADYRGAPAPLAADVVTLVSQARRALDLLRQHGYRP